MPSVYSLGFFLVIFAFKTSMLTCPGYITITLFTKPRPTKFTKNQNNILCD